MRTSFEIAISIIKEIEGDKELLACKSFSELHDFCDANMLGAQEGEFASNEEELYVALQCFNEAQSLVDSWLKVRDKTYFSLDVASDMRTSNCIENASAIADLQEVVHNLKEKYNDLLELSKNLAMSETTTPAWKLAFINTKFKEC